MLKHNNSSKTRFIPAHAGNTADKKPVDDIEPVHPRACGEHLFSPYSTRQITGSSPRMRGTRGRRRRTDPVPRFIPAHAGNTFITRGTKWICTVHPRACGEHERHSPRSIISYGSSPRMRGTLGDRDVLLIDRRFIPAHAGNTSRYDG